MQRSRSIRPAWIAIVLAVVAGMIGATPAYAITGGQPDGGAHPQVGLIYQELADGRVGICTGTLIGPKTLLTAGHCTAGYSRKDTIRVSFDDQVTGESTFHEVRGWETHPDYVSANWPWTVDVGVVYLKKAVDLPVAYLPEARTLEWLIPERGASNYIFTDVGYGQAGVDTSGVGPPVPNFPLQRRVSWQTYHPGGNEWVGSMHGYDELMLQLKASPSSQHGSGCGGDSGGPIFLDDQMTIVAIHTGGYRLGYDGSVCGRISSLNHRIDTEAVLNWLQ